MLQQFSFLMNSANPPSAEHQDIWELLPWFVNESLSEPDRVRVEAHLLLCGACRNEHAAQRQIYQVIAADSAVEQMPTAGLNKLRRSIREGGSTGAAQKPSDRPPPPSLNSSVWRPRAGAIAASVLAAAAAFVISAAVHWNQTRRQGEAAPYYTVTAAAPQHAGAVIRAVFTPTLTLSELQVLLEDAHLSIVAGPTEAGVYSLEVSGPQSIDWSLRQLRGHDTVRFAEAIGSAPVGAPPP
jgi:hypothetical protein